MRLAEVVSMYRRLSRLVVPFGVALASPAAIVACGSGGADPAGAPSCPTLVIPDACPSSPPSWKAEVQPLVAKYCYVCHGHGGIGQSKEDFSTYQGVKKAGPTIAFQVQQCLMPQPGAAQPTASERETLITWALVCRAPDN
jgi:hypothetical protein